MKTRPHEFIKFLKRIPQGVVVAFIPVKPESKEPDVGIPIKSNPDKVKLTPNDALRRLQQGRNVGVYAFPQGLCFVDIDRPDLVDINEFPESFTVKTRNGGFQIYYLNTDIDRNYILKLDGQKIGELRANWQYVLTPGSYVEPDEDAFEGATGVYEVVRDVEMKPLNLEAIRKFIECEKSEKKGNEKKEVVKNGHFVNKYSISLDAILQVDERLNELLNNLNPGYPSRSEADMAAIDRLWFWQFDESTIGDILRAYRLYEKTERDDYLYHTIEKATTSFTGKRFNPAKNPQLFLKLCKIQEDLSKGGMSRVGEEISGSKHDFHRDVYCVQHVRASPYFKLSSEDPLCSKNKIKSCADILDNQDNSVETAPNDEQPELTLDMEVKIVDLFFDENGKFIAKRLADEIMSEVRFATLTDTEEVGIMMQSQEFGDQMVR